MSENGKYLIGESFRAKLKSTISKVDSMPLGGNDKRAPTSLQDDLDVYQPRKFRAATFSGSWAIGSDKTVTFRDTSISPTTASVTNLFCSLAPEGSCDVSVARDGTAWYLVSPNLTQQPGYSASNKQILTTVGGSLQWIEPKTTTVLTSVSLGNDGLKFTKMDIKVFETVSSSSVTIGTTACV